MRLLVTETLDPDGAMHRWCTPDLLALGHEALPLPTQELAPLLGPDGLAAWIVAVAEAARPDAVLLCPPYDHVSRATLGRLTTLGAQPIAFCFDEPLFHVNAARAEALAGYRHRFVTAPDRVVSLPQPASWVRWAASPAAFFEQAELPEAWRTIHDAVVLVGRPYMRRIELVKELAARGVPVVVFGHGWGEPNIGFAPSGTPQVGPPLTGPEMHAVLSRAGLVLTTGDWEAQALPMVKYRLLEAAFCGGPQIVQRSPDLSAYFGEDEVASYETLDELAERAQVLLADKTAARAMAERARDRAHREHTWQVRFAELSLEPEPRSRQGDPTPAAYLAGLSLIAHDAERRGAQRLAAAAFSSWGSLAPNPTAAAGLARLGDGPTFSAHALTLLAADPRPAAGLYARLPTHIGTGLGQVGYLDPSAELTAMQLAAVLGGPDVDLAAAKMIIAALQADPDRLVATAALLIPDGPDESLPIWRALFAAALAAKPGTRDFDEHRARWREALED